MYTSHFEFFDFSCQKDEMESNYPLTAVWYYFFLQLHNYFCSNYLLLFLCNVSWYTKHKWLFSTYWCFLPVVVLPLLCVAPSIAVELNFLAFLWLFCWWLQTAHKQSFLDSESILFFLFCCRYRRCKLQWTWLK